VDEDAEGEDGDETDSEDASSEDEDGEELTFAVDAAILRTLARIKRKDPGIYDVDRGVFEGARFRFILTLSTSLIHVGTRYIVCIEEQQKITPVHEPPLRNPNKSVKASNQKALASNSAPVNSALSHRKQRSP
jgi:hypothetical protein